MSYLNDWMIMVFISEFRAVSSIGGAKGPFIFIYRIQDLGLEFKCLISEWLHANRVCGYFTSFFDMSDSFPSTKNTLKDRLCVWLQTDCRLIIKTDWIMWLKCEGRLNIDWMKHIWLNHMVGAWMKTDI